ncbi:hypothetical protein SERLADRAFT_476357 [Serpula lacrymans var. lacrymans S7.9]|uniref:Uncharacterized protein n=1 Tax=Serpula lacrymans var. lacrymans (strain S7.9) TaxID=578457 RepID=F8P7A5_SERL9|nr:uncharacterized protein SERLADRAFT_476357 [Serpula lacrymans var. lacrymans S7.9]EGO21321.1 hypothetical protein SERLADRAFT_476357 [Serpula lacrymans var. lacrymans S7.9]
MRSLRFYSESHRERYPTLLLRLLYRDAVIFFTFSILNSALVIFAWTVFSDGPINNIPVTFTVPLLNIAGQRLVLNLRSTMAHSQRHAMDTTRLDQEVSRQIRAFVGVESDPMLSGHECNCALGCECVCDDQDVALPTSSSCCEHQLAERVERQRLGDVELTEVADSEDVDSYYARNS